MPTKRIHNTTTGKYMKIAERSSKNRKKGSITGSWSPKK